MQWKWCYKEGYAVRNRSGREKGLIYMHRVILERMGFTDFEECDHTNRDRSDNRRRNLRSASRYQNNRNHDKQRNNTSGFIGVYWHRQRKKWCAQIKVNGKRKHLGLFTDKGEAACVYNAAARKYHGEFAVLNKE
jgi:hypothetical protein